ncbi:MAG: SUMF1/EgtB/PvdO family nonheme iron enzyme [Planctomycetes bacterium]|nr:SUMF1/EgtB/PvdO family nonheme iron enzyme [Planctomycetota bacterium]
MRRPALAAILLLAGCGVGGGGALIPGAAGTPGATAPLIDRTRAGWQVLDLASGQATALAAVPDLAGNPAYRDRLLVFRLVDDGLVAAGQGLRARQDDELPATQAAPACYLGVAELTRAQWRLLAGSAPWLGLPGGEGGDDRPAGGLGLAAVQAALARWNGGHGLHLGLPSALQWEAAARAGGTATWPWGEDYRQSVVRQQAVTWETQQADGGSGPQPFGARQANAWGFHDLCGNQWELVADGSARGGSWADSVSLARPANRILPEPDARLPTVGVRLVYMP